MEKKINIAQLLKDCPRGMELDSPVWNNIVFEEIDEDNIVILRKSIREKVYLTKYGEVNSIDGKCIIFPKGKTTWKGFVPPCQFKDGDIISGNNYIAIFHKIGTPYPCASNVVYHHCYYNQNFCNFKNKLGFGIGVSTEFKYATKEEKEKLFKVIKENGYKWNAETKTLEKLSKFKAGDKVWHKASRITREIKAVYDDFYILIDDSRILVHNQDQYELVPEKFNIGTLKPFDEVLVRYCNEDRWSIDFFGYYKNGFYITNTCSYKQCVPYKGNEHLLGTTDDCDNYFKTWEEGL